MRDRHAPESLADAVERREARSLRVVDAELRESIGLAIAIYVELGKPRADADDLDDVCERSEGARLAAKAVNESLASQGKGRDLNGRGKTREE